MVVKMKNKEKGNLTSLSTIAKVFLIFLFILILKLKINILMLNFLLIISAIEILATNYRRSRIKWLLMLIQLYSIILYITIQIMGNSLSVFSGILYMFISLICMIVDFSIYIEKL